MTDDLPWQMSATLTGIPNRAQYICQACCGKVRLKTTGDGVCVTECPDHPSIIIRDGKVVGTSA